MKELKTYEADMDRKVKVFTLYLRKLCRGISGL